MPGSSMPWRGSQRSRVRKQPLEELETLCSDLAVDPPQSLTLDNLLICKNAIPENDQSTIWDSVSERALPGLLSIYAASIRNSGPLLKPGSVEHHHVVHNASVRAALSKQLSAAGALDADRSYRLALSILRSQTLRCYAVLLGDAAESLLRRPSKRNEDIAGSLLSEVDGIAQFVLRGATSRPGSGPLSVLEALGTELAASSLLEHWARLLLVLAGCEGSKRALAVAAANVACLSRALTAFLMRVSPDCAHSLLGSSPCLSYFAVSQMVGLCAMQDFGTVYGMPRVPCGVLVEAALALQPPQMAVGSVTVLSLDAFACFAGDMLAALCIHLERLLQQDADPSASGSGPTADNSGTAGVEGMKAYADAAGESLALAGAGAGTAGATAAAAAEEQEPQQHPGHEGAVGQRGRGELAAASASARAGGRNDVPPPALVNPMVLLEISLRLATALCASAAKLQGLDPPLDIPPRSRGGGTGTDRCPDEWQPQAPGGLSLDGNIAASVGTNALAVARRLIHETPSAAAATWLRPTGRGSGGSACTPAALARTAPSPLERWWEGAVAVAGGLTAAVSESDSKHAQDDRDVAAALNRYFQQLKLMLAASVRLGDRGPSDSVAAALSAGFLPCLERLLPAALPLASASSWQLQLGPGWDAAWAQMLAFGEKGQTAAVICAAAEGLREALAAFRAALASAGQVGPGAAATASSGGSVSGGGDVWQLYSAVSVATWLVGKKALGWLSRLAGGQGPDSGVSDSSPAPALTASAPAACGPATRLGGSLSLIAARLLPELSRAVLEALLPWADSGHHEVVCYLLDRQLAWVPILVGALATESAPAAAVTAAEPAPAAAAGVETVPEAAVACGSGGSGSGSTNCSAASGTGVTSSSALRWRQLLLIELRLPRLLGAALGFSLGCNGADPGFCVRDMRLHLRTALVALVAHAPTELARMVAAADRAEAAAPGRAASGRGPAGGPAPHSPPPPPSSGLLRRALGPGGPLEDAALLAAVEAACAGGAAGKGAGMLLGDLAKAGVGDLLSGGRLLSLQD